MAKGNPGKAAPKGPAGIERITGRTTYALAILVVITFVVYARSLTLEYTKLDDTIFIVENARYNADAGNLAVSFQRGLFNPTKDAYYRPLFLVDFILESRLFGVKPAGYHFTNLLFHILSVILLYLFLKRIRIPATDSLLLALLFAVHPVLTQAVAWIPGRNDMLLMIFFLSAFILLLQHIEKPSPWRLALHSLLFLLALFTKETAVIIPVIMASVALVHMKSGWRKLILPAAGWAVAAGVWMTVRSTATLTKSWISPPDMIRAGIDRLGVILQYLGKIFFPFNLAVFPEAQDITLWWGVLALAGLTALVVWSKSYRKPLTWLGLAWFLVFLLPVLIVPKSLNDQVFEHRLYLPLVGILLMLSQSWPFGSFTPPKTRTAIVAGIAVVFSAVCIVRTAYFSDAVTFWTKAVEGSPHSAYARTLLGTKTEDAAEREKLFREAYALDPELKNLNFYLGKALFDQKKDSAEYYLRREIARNEVPDAYFMLAQIAFLRENYDSAGILLEKVIELNPLDPQANHNLVLLYWQHGKPEKSRETLRRMQEKGMAVDNDLMQMVNGK